MSNRYWAVFAVAFAATIAGYFGFQIGYVRGVESAMEPEPFRHGELTVWNDGDVASVDRIGAALLITPSPTGTILSGYRKHDTGEWDERIEFFIPKDSIAEVRALPEGMNGLYGSDLGAWQEPEPRVRKPVPYDPTPRFTVDPPLD